MLVVTNYLHIKYFQAEYWYDSKVEVLNGYMKVGKHCFK